MNEQEKHQYLEEYKQAKAHGVPFFPDVVFKDVLVSGLIFVVLIGLIVFVGVPLEDRANPADASYIPRPEWYFLWIFQLLKYFPGSLEAVATVVLPTAGILLLLLLPFYDRSPRRHPRQRPLATGLMTLIVVGMLGLTWQAVATTPKPKPNVPESPEVQAAQSYTQNCAPCHGATVIVRTGADLHKIIAEGLSHEGMPAWGGNFTSDEIDLLVSYVSAPDGAELFRQNCAACHDLSMTPTGGADPLRQVIAAGPKGQVHQGQDVADWGRLLSSKQINALVNFVLAQQPRKLYEYYCSGCHGNKLSVPQVKADQLRQIIRQGGKHRTMPGWKGTLSEQEIATLADYIANPDGPAAAQGKPLFEDRCSQCHGDRLPADGSGESIRNVIALGGPHETMPAWGEVLSDDQIDSLVQFILSPPSGAEEGRKLFEANCTGCHGKYGEGGPNPARPGDIIHPISSSDFLSTRDDQTIHAIIAQGQPNFGMVPFSTDNGGPLDDEQIDQIVAFMRTWESNPPVVPETRAYTPTPAISGKEIFARACAQCHGENGEGKSAPPLNAREFLDQHNDAQIRRIIVQGMRGSSMWAWGDLGLLSGEQVDELVKYIRSWQPTAPSRAEMFEGPSAALGDPQRGEQFFSQFCSGCHGRNGEMQVSGVVLHSPELLQILSDERIVRQILEGGKQMPAFHSVLTRQQANDLLAYLRTWQPGYVPPTPAPTLPPAATATPAAAGGVSFARDVLPIFQARCVACHGEMGGWSAADYNSVTTSGQHSPVVVPGDPDNSLIIQKLQGTQTLGMAMPPGSSLSQEEIDLIVRWIQAGAPDD